MMALLFKKSSSLITQPRAAEGEKATRLPGASLEDDTIAVGVIRWLIHRISVCLKLPIAIAEIKTDVGSEAQTLSDPTEIELQSIRELHINTHRLIEAAEVKISVGIRSV